MSILSDLHYALRVAVKVGGVHPRRCPGCGHHGKFKAFGMPPRFDAKCPQCGTLERHRLFILADEALQLVPQGSEVLHVAPEALIRDRLKSRCSRYVSLDLYDPKADVQEPLEKTSFPDESFDVVVCSHVLEHVDDRAAMREMHRVLKRDGKLLAMVPIIEGWVRTYENQSASVAGEKQRDLHFGQWDHIRYYGRDFRDRLTEADFDVVEYTAEGEAVIQYGLSRGEKVFIARKANKKSNGAATH